MRRSSLDNLYECWKENRKKRKENSLECHAENRNGNTNTAILKHIFCPLFSTIALAIVFKVHVFVWQFRGRFLRQRICVRFFFAVFLSEKHLNSPFKIKCSVQQPKTMEGAQFHHVFYIRGKKCWEKFQIFRIVQLDMESMELHTQIAPSQRILVWTAYFEKWNRMGSEFNDGLHSKIVIIYWLIYMFGFELLNVSIAPTANCIPCSFLSRRCTLLSQY